MGLSHPYPVILQWLYLCWRLIVCRVRQTQIATHVVVRADVLRPTNIAAAGWALGVLAAAAASGERLG